MVAVTTPGLLLSTASMHPEPFAQTFNPGLCVGVDHCLITTFTPWGAWAVPQSQCGGSGQDVSTPDLHADLHDLHPPSAFQKERPKGLGKTDVHDDRLKSHNLGLKRQLSSLYPVFCTGGHGDDGV